MEPPEITLVTQPPFSQCCGQACIAMIAGKTLDEACAAVGHNESTSWIELKKGLAKLTTSHRLTCYDTNTDLVPETCIAKLCNPNDAKHCHWIVLWNGKIYCPSGELAPAWPIVGTIEIRRNIVPQERVQRIFYRRSRIDHEKVIRVAELLEEVYKLGQIPLDGSPQIVDQIMKLSQELQAVDPDFDERVAIDFAKMCEVSDVETSRPICTEVPAGPYTSGFPNPLSSEDSGRDPFDRPGGETAQRQ